MTYMATGGKGMTRDRLRTLRGFYQNLIEEDLVVEFDPNIPPGKPEGDPKSNRKKADGYKFGGFAYQKRVPEDGNLIIRVNEHTTLTPEGEVYLTLPDVLPLDTTESPQ